MGLLLLVALAAPVAPVGYDGAITDGQIVWSVEAPSVAEASLRRSLPAAARVSGAALDADRRTVRGAGPGLAFTVTLPLSQGEVAPPFLDVSAIHRVIVRGAALDFDGAGVTRGVGYRAGPQVTAALRARADDLLSARRFGAAAVYLRDPGRLGPGEVVARLAPDGGRRAVWVVVALFAGVLIGCGFLYRRTARRARWERTQVALREIAGDPWP